MPYEHGIDRYVTRIALSDVLHQFLATFFFPIRERPAIGIAVFNLRLAQFLRYRFGEVYDSSARDWMHTIRQLHRGPLHCPSRRSKKKIGTAAIKAKNKTAQEVISSVLHFMRLDEHWIYLSCSHIVRRN